MCATKACSRSTIRSKASLKDAAAGGAEDCAAPSPDGSFAAGASGTGLVSCAGASLEGFDSAAAEDLSLLSGATGALAWAKLSTQPNATIMKMRETFPCVLINS